MPTLEKQTGSLVESALKYLRMKRALTYVWNGPLLTYRRGPYLRMKAALAYLRCREVTSRCYFFGIISHQHSFYLLVCYDVEMYKVTYAEMQSNYTSLHRTYALVSVISHWVVFVLLCSDLCGHVENTFYSENIFHRGHIRYRGHLLYREHIL